MDDAKKLLDILPKLDLSYERKSVSKLDIEKFMILGNDVPRLANLIAELCTSLKRYGISPHQAVEVFDIAIVTHTANTFGYGKNFKEIK